MKKLSLAFFFLIISFSAIAQTHDCYPNSTVSFDVIERERIPSITSVEAIGTKCRDDADKKLQQYRNEDMANFNFLKNKYFAALSGWEQTGDCEHGGPPPCCTAPAGNVPWANVGPAQAQAALMAEWHKVQNQRQVEVENAMNACLKGLKDDGLDKFNTAYSQATDCLKTIQDNKMVAEYNGGLITGYVTQLNSLHQQMETLGAKKPDPDAVWNVTNEMLKLQSEICEKATKLANPIKNTPGTGYGGVRAEVTPPKAESQAITNSSANAQAKQQAATQQKANDYVVAANNSTEDIDKARNLNMAKVNAAASGNTQQVAEIQQAQNQQMQQNITDLGSQLLALINTPKNRAPILTQEQEQLQKDERTVTIDDQVTSDMGYRDGIIAFDKYDNAVRNGDIVLNNEKQNVSGGEMYTNGVFENAKYHDPQRAMEWFIKSADKNYPLAIVRLAKMTESSDRKLSALMTLKAAMLVDSPVYKNDGTSELEKDCIEKAVQETAFNYRTQVFNGSNYRQALYWLSKTKDNDLEIGSLYETGDATLPKDMNEAITIYKKVAASNNRYLSRLGYEKLANIYESSTGPEKNLDMAIECYQKIIELADKNSDQDVIKGAKKAIKACEKAKKGN